MYKAAIEKLWNGELAPSENCGAKNPEIEDIIRLMERNRSDLEKELNGHQKERLEKYIDCTEEYAYRITEQAFCDGFCIASRLLTEALT